MRRVVTILLLISSLMGILHAQEEPEQLKFRLLTANEYDLSLSISTVINRFYANVEFSVNPQQMGEADFYSFFITKMAYVERIKINGKAVDFHYTRELDPRHFEPELEYPQLLSPDADIYCISLDQKHFDQLDQPAVISIDYKMVLPDWTVDNTGRQKIEWQSRDFFYPKNVLSTSRLNITLLTTIFHSVEAADNVQDSGTMRKIYRSIVEYPALNATLTLYKG